MRQLTFIRPGKLEWAEVSVPRLEMRQEAIVRPIVVGRCDLDTGYVAGGWPTQIGIYAAGIAVALGAGRVVYVDTYENRLALAQRFGARARNPPIALKPEYGIVVDSCRDADTLRRAIRATELEGIFTRCTIHRGDATPLPLQEIIGKALPSERDAQMFARRSSQSLIYAQPASIHRCWRQLSRHSTTPRTPFSMTRSASRFVEHESLKRSVLSC